MKSTTKQRIFWGVAALLTAAMLLLLYYQKNANSLVATSPITESAEVNPENAMMAHFQRPLFFGFSIWHLLYFFLCVLLGFLLYNIFPKTKTRIYFAFGSGILFCSILAFWGENHLHTGLWYDALAAFAGITAGIVLAVLAVIFLRFLSKWFSNSNSKRQQRLETIFDAMAIVSVMHYVVFRFLQSTMFGFYYSDRYKTITLLSLILTGGLRYLYLLLKKVLMISEPKKQSLLLLRHMLVFSLAIPFFLVGWMHNYKLLFFLPFTALCLYDMEPEKVFRAFLFTVGTVLAATLLCCLSNTVRNLVSQDSRVVAAYGTINSTDYASYFSFLLLTAWCSMKNRKWQISVLFAILTGIISYIVFYFTDSRTVLAVGLLTILFVLWDCLEDTVLQKKGKLRRVRKGIDWISIFAFPLIGALVIILVAGYGQKIPWFSQMNKSLSQRLKVVWRPYLLYGIHPFGSTIETMLGQGRTIISKINSGYSYLDIAYAMLAIRYGWVITAIVAGLWIWFTARAIKSDKKRIAFTMAIMAAHAFSEARILDVNYNILLVMPFCALSPNRESKNTVSQSIEINESKRLWRQGILCFFVMASIWIALPTALSWLRSFFALMHWNSGMAAFASFVFCVAIVLLLWLLWKALSMLWIYRSKKAFALFICTVLMLTSGIFAMNSVINKGLETQDQRLAAEEQIIRQVQQAAVLPVYAAEASELYQRRIGGFEKQIFSTEELGRSPQGSIFVDHSVDAMAITQSGGQYVPISDWSGLYSYDPSVIEMLTDTGYTWQSFYSNKTICNLKEAAILNGLKAEDKPELHGPIRFITKNMEIDHSKGLYVISFTLSSPLPTESGDVVTLEILANAGERLLLQATITADDFDAQGKCSYSIIYQTANAPLVSYAVSVPEGACVTVEEITHQRMGQRVTLQDGINHLINPSDNWSAWLMPANNSTKNYVFETMIMHDNQPGDAYHCQIEIEFKDVSPIEGESFSLITQGAVDGTRKIANIWNKNLIHLTEAPENGVYRYTATSFITDSNANAAAFDLEFHCENWASGAFKVKSIAIEKIHFITVQPSDETVKEGEIATFYVNASDATGYQWYYQKPGETSWNRVKINGSSATYTLTTEARHNGYKYRCKISSDIGTVYSSIAVLTVE